MITPWRSSDCKKYERDMQHATSYEAWHAAAGAYDAACGHHYWRRMDQSRHFDYVSIRLKLDKLRALRTRQDYPGLLFALNEGVHGNVDGMGKPELYQKSKVGTKHLIESYVEEIAEVLELLAGDEVEGVGREEQLDFFRRANCCFGRTALMLSGSGMLAYFHLGVVKALSEQDLLPNIISGSSGGSIVGSLVATHDASELTQFFDAELLYHEFESESEDKGLLSKLRSKFLRVENLVKMVEHLIPDITFQESMDKTGICMNVSVAPKETHQTSRLLNATTSPNLLMREAILASCALPGVFPAVTLMARDKYGYKKEYLPSRQWVDGAISDDLPMRRLSRLYGVNHYIVSQTNPHIIPFVSDAKRSRSSTAALTMAATRSSREWLNAVATVMHGTLAKRPHLNQLTNRALAVLNQDYIGDVNILPPFRLSNPTRLMAALTKEEIAKLISMGEKATWPKIEMIRTQTRISRLLNQIVEKQPA